MKKIIGMSMLLASLFLLEACEKISDSTTSSDTGSDDIFTNGGFEMGNLDGWTTTGMAFSDDDISSESTINNVDSNKTGSYFLNGSKSSLASAKGTLTSGVFRVDGTGYVSYKIGAAKDQNKIYLEFYEDGGTEPLAFKANGGEDEVTRIGNVDFDEVYRNDTMTTNYIDLTAYNGKDLRVVITDNDTNNNEYGDDYSYINFDDFTVITTNIGLESAKTQREKDLKKYANDFEEDPTSTSLRNGSFENGFDGWKVVSGDALTGSQVVSAEGGFWSTRSFHAAGNYLLNGESKNGGSVGTVRSEKFTIESTDGNKYVSFRLGGAKRSSCYVALCDGNTGEELVKVTNDQLFSDPDASLNMFLHVLDVTQYKGRVLYFLIADQDRSTEGFDFLTCDDFRINLSESEAIALINEEKDAVENYDAADKNTYGNVYGNKLSFPIAGNAPVINTDGLVGGYVYTVDVEGTESYNFLSLANDIKNSQVESTSENRIYDDYTATSDLSVTIESVSVNGGDDITENLSSFDISKPGYYSVNFSVEDAYGQQTKGKALVVSDRNSIVSTTITNGGFETGDLTGWTATGEAFTDSGVVGADTKFWTSRDYHGVGSYLFDGSGLEGKTGELRSNTFQVEDGEGERYLSFLMGAASSSDNYIALCSADDNSELVKVTNEYFKDPELSLNMVRHYVDLTSYKGRNVYVKIVDATTSGFGFLTFDDFQANLTADEVKALYTQTKAQSNYSADSVAASSYEDVYQNRISLGFAGDAPTVAKDDSTLESAFAIDKGETSSAFDLTTYISNIRSHVTDDYTARNDLTIEITSVTKPDSTEVSSGFTSFDLSTAGTYTVKFSASDAFSQSVTGQFDLVVTNTVNYEITNGGFETGDLTGWTATGEAFTDSGVVGADTKFWTSRDYHGVGSYLFDGSGLEGKTGELRSNTFQVEDGEGERYLSFLMGAASSSDNYIALCSADDNSELVKVTNEYFKDPELSLNMVRRYVDLTSYKGRNVYVKIVDATTSGFGFLTFDDFQANLTADEVKALYTQTKAQSNYSSDSVAASSYEDVYQNRISLGFAGDAPTVAKDDSTLESAFTIDKGETSSAFDLTTYISNIRSHVTDDYTARNDLAIEITSVTKPDSTEVSSGFTSFDLSTAGTYTVKFSASDAFSQSVDGQFDLVVTNTVNYEITNGGFETGDMSGWTLKSGTFNMEKAVGSDSTFWDEKIPFNKTGDYFVNGWNAGAEGDVWEVQSSTFTLGGSGYISFKMAGRAAVLNVYDATTDTKIASYANTAFADNGVYVSNNSRLGTMTKFVADLSAYKGRKLYITIEDNQTSNWGVAFFDEIVTYYEDAIDVTDKYDTVTQPDANGSDVETKIYWVKATNSLTTTE